MRTGHQWDCHYPPLVPKDRSLPDSFRVLRPPKSFTETSVATSWVPRTRVSAETPSFGGRGGPGLGKTPEGPRQSLTFLLPPPGCPRVGSTTTTRHTGFLWGFGGSRVGGTGSGGRGVGGWG